MQMIVNQLPYWCPERNSTRCDFRDVDIWPATLCVMYRSLSHDYILVMLTRPGVGWNTSYAVGDFVRHLDPRPSFFSCSFRYTCTLSHVN